MEEIHYINHDVKLDFHIPRDIQMLMDECERLDAVCDVSYYNYAEVLDHACKEAYVQKHFTKEQWDRVMERYRY